MSATHTIKYAILGGGLVAGYAAQEFVAQGVKPGELCIISAENMPPYERPPLSKSFLTGEKSTADLLINEAGFYDEHGIELLLDTCVDQVDFAAKTLSAGEKTIGYDSLLIATGAEPRRFDMPWAKQSNVYYLRRVEDSRRIREKMETAAEAIVIGGGFIGMETAAVLQSNSVETTMLFMEDRVWEAVFSPEISQFFESYYRERGVTILPGMEIELLAGEPGRVQVITAERQAVAADMVVAGIGVLPNSDLFVETELQLVDGFIQVNRFLETNQPDVFAAGDVTLYRDLIFDKPLHIEHWDNAVEQGRHAACVMLGQYQPFEHVPYFFSDVFDLSYEYWGDSSDADQVVYRGDLDTGSFSAWWLGEDSRLLAAFVMDRPDEEREMAPEWIRNHKQLDPDWLRESETFQAEPETT